MVVSSAKLQTSTFLMKSTKAGTNIDPCGTFLRIPRYELKVAPIFTR